MRSKTTENFRRCFELLPSAVQDRARSSFRRFEADPRHGSLRFKRVHTTLPVFSVRVSKGYRAVAIREEEVLIWF